MTKIGRIYLGGREGHDKNGIVYYSGVAFELVKKSPIDGTYEIPSTTWEVELQKDNQHIIARSKDVLTEDQIVNLGFAFCQKYLDLLSVARKVNLGIQNPFLEHILVFNNCNRMITRIVLNGDLGYSAESIITLIDKDGNKTEIPPSPLPDWTPAFRFYRISQSATDLYDAYRNLYLAFEALLQEIEPRNERERETDWISRALNTVAQKIPLQKLVPKASDPILEIKEYHYQSIRCRLFHAKDRNYILPEETPDTEKLSEAYEDLLNIWRQIAVTFKAVPGGGSVITYEGFMTEWDSIANHGVSLNFTDDPSPDNAEDTQISPLGHPVYSTIENYYVRDYRPGVVLFTGKIENPRQIGLELIHRVCMTFGKTCSAESLKFKDGLERCQNVLFSVKFYDSSISPFGTDILECYQTIRLINKSSPKTIF